MEKKQAMTPEESYADYVWRETEVKPECNHWTHKSSKTNKIFFKERWHYCPECGEKL